MVEFKITNVNNDIIKLEINNKNEIILFKRKNNFITENLVNKRNELIKENKYTGERIKFLAQKLNINNENNEINKNKKEEEQNLNDNKIQEINLIYEYDKIYEYYNYSQKKIKFNIFGEKFFKLNKDNIELYINEEKCEIIIYQYE